MFELFKAGGPLMWIILICSLVALTIVFERLLTLRKKQVAPASLRQQVLDLVRTGRVTKEKIDVIRQHSPLGAVFASGLDNLPYGADSMREGLEEAGKQVVHRLGRYLNTLGTIASITPLIGLLGTVIGMIKVFTAITASGVGDPTVLSGGISEALITTAAGLSVGIPCLMFYRHFRGRINELAVLLEENALALLDTQKA
ncbi:MotA/TolQ/ExbB proton channel family protein [Arenicella xantha]|uniref:Biopolymer transport protein ExbB n=1 Tax=Arenicella xantha TaxID=644221 RepID=A0A395JJ70_9GAMM|nr:MotA/TolQ/ExbB proton channel family protein [Arenicella xantha]RBP50833.1 biopolymer transport protein ExbB [Arenicella xantha]